VHRRATGYEAKKDNKLTIQRFFDRMAHFIPENSIVIAETGNAEFSVAETHMPSGVTVLAQVFYGSIGYTVGSTLGAAIADPNRPILLFVGDGSFQLTAQEVSTMIRYKCNKVIIFLLNNDGYTIERMIQDNVYNDIQMWKYHKLPEVFLGKPGYDVHNEGQLEEALSAVSKSNALGFVEAHFERMDCSPAMKKAGEAMQKTNAAASKEK